MNPACDDDDDDCGMEICGIWMPDGVLFCICSFLCRHEISDVLPRSERDLLASCFFRNFSRTSKDSNALVHRWVRKIPLVLKISQRNKQNYEKIEWICRNRVKLRHCDLYVRGNNEAALCKYILSSCNLAELESCTMHFIEGKHDVKESEVFEVGIPYHAIQKKNKKFMEEFRHTLAEFVPKRAMSLKRMALTLKGELCPSLLRAFSYSLEDLEMKIFAPDGSSSMDSEDLHAPSQVIEKLSKLKRLKIKAMFKASFTVRSNTLEVIDTTGSRGFYVETCVCKSLRKFICDHKKDYSKEWSNGVKPFELFSDEDISVGEEILEVQSKSHPFVGLIVPDNCTVRMKTS